MPIKVGHSLGTVMQRFRNLCAFLCVLLALAVAPSWAVEPGAPEKLISQEEALIFGVRLQLDRAPTPSGRIARPNRIALANFYASHNGPLLWVNASGLTERAKRLVREIRRAGEWGLKAADFELPEIKSKAFNTTELVGAELKMSVALIKYAQFARGGRMEPRRLSKDFDRVPAPVQVDALLRELLQSQEPEKVLRRQHPPHREFEQLRLAYLAALKSEAAGDAGSAPASVQQSQLKKPPPKLLTKNRASNRILYNMEMWRWMPRTLGAKYIQANVPEFKIRVIDGGRIAHEERIVVGKVANKTPIFSDELELVVFHPFWNVPDSIKVKEILPSLIRGGNVLEKQNLRMKYRGREINPYAVDWASTDIRKFHVYQPPSRRNALGIVKFLFPNKHAIYFHDTPTKHLFKRKYRAYSHGCMRVRDPLKLAEVLLSADKGWRRSKIDSLVRNGPKNNEIRLGNKIPVHVTYFTARADSNGTVRFLKDIYGHERRIALGLQGKFGASADSETRLSQVRKRTVTADRRSRRKRTDRSWRRRIYGN